MRSNRLMLKGVSQGQMHIIRSTIRAEQEKIHKKLEESLLRDIDKADEYVATMADAQIEVENDLRDIVDNIDDLSKGVIEFRLRGILEKFPEKEIIN